MSRGQSESKSLLQCPGKITQAKGSLRVFYSRGLSRLDTSTCCGSEQRSGWPGSEFITDLVTQVAGTQVWVAAKGQGGAAS